MWRSITECCVQLKEGDGLPPVYETQCLHPNGEPPEEWDHPCQYPMLNGYFC